MKRSASFLLLFGIVVIIVVGVIVFNSLNSGEEKRIESIVVLPPGESGQSQNQGSVQNPVEESEETPNIEEHETSSNGGETFAVEIFTSGFSPSTLTISEGDSVSFINQDIPRHWPATNMHPTHRVYPNSDISKCGTAEATQIFDACRGLEQGETYSFTFNELGTWEYHDHLKPALTGKIVVQ